MNYKTFTITLILSLMAFFSAIANDQNPYVRQPAISPDGEKVLFTYQGDIWQVSHAGGLATRITSHPANEQFPAWSPDGSSLAFSSDRNGNYDIFSLSLDGAPLTQLTYHSKNDYLSSWTQEKILFTSSRFYAQVEREHDMLRISAEGGTPERFVDAVGYQPVASPSGDRIAFVRGSCPTSREDYRGPANRDIWVYHEKNDSFHQITDFDGNDFHPKWKNDSTLVFISARNGKYNLFEKTIGKQNTPEKEAKALTDFREDGIRYFSISGDGQKIAFEKDTRIYLMHQEEINPIDITLTRDQPFASKEHQSYKKDIENYKLSPEEKQMAFVVKGKLFVKYNDKRAKDAKLLTDEYARVRSFAWLNENTILYTSDKQQQYDIYSVSSLSDETLFESLKTNYERLTKTSEDESSLKIHPQTKHIAFVRGNGKLITAIFEDGAIRDEKTLLDGWATPSGLTWSPDGTWLAYSKRDLKGNSEIYIHAADNSRKPVNVSLHPRSDVSPAWSRDKLAFISERNNGDRDIWFVWLRKEDWERTKTEWKHKEYLKDTTQKDDSSEIKIDFDNIYKRITQVTGHPGNESDLQVSPDGETFYFVTNRNDRRQYKAHNDLHSVKWDGSELKTITEGNKKPYRVHLDKNGKNLYFLLQGGKAAKVNIKSQKTESLPFKAETWVDYAQRREQIFEEGWRALNRGFYDPNFHGKDWNALKKKYKPRCMKASTNEDFRYTFNLMLGQINASHMGIRNVPKRYDTPKIRTGLLGIDIQPDKKGVRVKKVLKNTPADRSASRLQPGDIIVSVNGKPLNKSVNFYQYLNQTAEQEVILEILREQKTLEVVIRPAESILTQRYEDWVETRRAIAEKESNGKLGYIHIRGMNWNSFEEFERELAASAYDKEGLVIDVRFNGGGWTTDYLMAILDVRQHAYTIPRGAAENLDEEHEKFTEYYPFGERLPFFPWTKPSITLCNQNSYSNAEIFSHAYKTLDLGKLVGTPTFGAVISTGGVGLADGSYVRLPFRAWYVKASGKNMENQPAKPDIHVNNPPDSKSKGKDPQLEKAVQELIKQL